MSAIYAVVSTTLNDYENYRTETQYEDNLILKKFLFEMFNNYSAIVFTAFLKNNIMSHGCSSGNSDFVIGEVNADILTWHIGDDGTTLKSGSELLLEFADEKDASDVPA